MEKSDHDDHDDDHIDHDDHHSSFIIMSRMHFSKVFQMCPTSKIVTNPDLPNVFCFFPRCINLLTLFVPAALASKKCWFWFVSCCHAATSAIWPGLGPMACHGGSHMFRRDHLGAETAQDG